MPHSEENIHTNVLLKMCTHTDTGGEATKRFHVPKPFSPSAEQGKCFFPCPRSRLRIWSRETGSTVPSRVSLLILQTQGESGAYSRASFLPPATASTYTVNRHRVSPEFIGLRYSVPMRCTIDTRAGTRAVVFKVAQVTGELSNQVITMDKFRALPLFPLALLHTNTGTNRETVCIRGMYRDMTCPALGGEEAQCFDLPNTCEWTRTTCVMWLNGVRKRRRRRRAPIIVQEEPRLRKQK